MTYALILAVCVSAYLAFLLHQRDRRIASLTDSRDVLIKHLWDSHLNDVQVWANRVQAPDVAVAQSVEVGDQIKQFTYHDDDADFVKAFEELD